MAGVKYLFPGEFKKPDFSDKYKVRGFFFLCEITSELLLLLLLIYFSPASKLGSQHQMAPMACWFYDGSSINGHDIVAGQWGCKGCCSTQFPPWALTCKLCPLKLKDMDWC
jgi:hypothetical protein